MYYQYRYRYGTLCVQEKKSRTKLKNSRPSSRPSRWAFFWCWWSGIFAKTPKRKKEKEEKREETEGQESKSERGRESDGSDERAKRKESDGGNERAKREASGDSFNLAAPALAHALYNAIAYCVAAAPG